MKRHLRFAAALMVLLAVSKAQAATLLGRSGPIDKPPAHTGDWCPHPPITFVADGSQVTMMIMVENLRSDGFWFEHTFDNISLVPTSVYNANAGFFANCSGGNCFGTTLDINAVAPQDFLHLETFDTGFDPGWDLAYGGYYGPEGNLTEDSTMTVLGDCGTRTGGWFGVGKPHGDVYASASIVMGGLTQGVSYTLSYWSSAQQDGLHWVDIYGANAPAPYACNVEEFVSSDAGSADAFGFAVDAHEDVAVVGAPKHGSTDDGAAYVYRRIDGIWYEQQKLEGDAGGPGSGDQFGYSVAVYGDVIAVGAPFSDEQGTDTGIVYLYRYDQASGLWSETDIVAWIGAFDRENFGWSVDLYQDVLAVGMPFADIHETDDGGVAIFRDFTQFWSPETVLSNPQAARFDQMGKSVSVHGGLVAAGIPDKDDTFVDDGGVAIFQDFLGGPWILLDILLSENPEASGHYGASVVLRDGAIAVGAPDEDFAFTDAGGVYTYEDTGTWDFVRRIQSDDIAGSDRFGSAVSMLGSKLMVGAERDEDASGTRVGAVYQFERTTTWVETDKLSPSSSLARSYGAAVALTDGFLVIGGPESNVAGANSGAAYHYPIGPDCDGDEALDVCEIAAGTSQDIDCDGVPDECVAPNLAWQLEKILSGDPENDDFFSEAIDIDGNVLVVGSRYHGHPAADGGSAYVYRYDGISWAFEQELIADDTAPDDWFGRTVAVSGNWIAVGAHQTDDLGTNSGSVYLFWYNGLSWTQHDELYAGDGSNDYNFGRHVALDGDVLAVGAGIPQSGSFRRKAAYIFEANGPVWTQKAKFVLGTDTSFEDLGPTVAVDDGQVLVGNDIANGFAGEAYVYRKSLSLQIWILYQILSPPGGGSSFGRFGTAVSISGSAAVVGATSGTNPASFDSGAYVFRDDGNLFNYEAKLEPSSGDKFTTAIAISGDRFVGGTPTYFGKQIEQGAAWLFRYNGVSWFEDEHLTPLDYQPMDRVGLAVAIDGEAIAVSAHLNDDDGNDAGAAYVFGTGQDCNGNFVPDSLDILGGSSLDISPINGIPDECETAVDDGLVPVATRLHQNAPNPFNPATEIFFDLPAGAGRVELTIYDAAGRRVRSLVDEALPAGRHRVTWRGHDDHGRAVASGVYYYVLETRQIRSSEKMVLLR